MRTNATSMSRYKHLAAVTDDKLTFELHVDAAYRKAHRHMYCYRKLQSFNSENTVMKMFY